MPRLIYLFNLLTIYFPTRRKSHFIQLLTLIIFFETMKKETWKFILQTIASILTAIATTLGVTSCLGV